jgi:putative methyltransferase
VHLLFLGAGGLSTKYRFHGLDRVKEIIEWCGRHRIQYVFNADSNFGMHPRDYQIAEFLVEAKRRYAHPDKFRTCFGKNTDERIFRVAKLLHEHELEKGITLARQSNDEEVLKNIKRQNIKLETYKSLQMMFNEHSIPVYTELILGLPGETYESWLRGIDDILNTGIRNQLFVYMCQVLTNTELADPEYLERFKIRTVRIPLAEIHGEVRAGYLETEYEDIVVETASMSTEDWRRMAKLSWVMQVFHSLKLAYFLMVYLHERYGVKYTDFLRYVSEERMPAGTGRILRSEMREFDAQLEGILAGRDRGRVMPGYGQFYWDVEEASFLRISERLPEFYAELLDVAKAFLSEQAIPYSEEELEEVVEYQRLRVPLPSGLALAGTKVFRHNLPEYFEHSYTTRQVPLRRAAQGMDGIGAKDYRGDRKNYARETILWGRKSGTMLTKIRWHDLEVSGAEARR